MGWPGRAPGGKGLVADIGQSGPAALLDLSEPIKVRMPLPWTSQRIAVAVEDLEGFLAGLAAQKVIIDSELEDPPGE